MMMMMMKQIKSNDRMMIKLKRKEYKKIWMQNKNIPVLHPPNGKKYD